MKTRTRKRSSLTLILLPLSLMFLSFFSTNTTHADNLATFKLASTADIQVPTRVGGTYYPTNPSGPGAGYGRVGQENTGGFYIVSRTLLRINTTGLPVNATITSVQLSVTIDLNFDSESLSWGMRLYRCDWTAGTAFACSPTTFESSLIVNQNTASLVTFGFAVNPTDINRKGFSNFTLRSAQDENQIVPTGTEDAYICGIENTPNGQTTNCNNAVFRPVLSVFYTLPAGGCTVNCGTITPIQNNDLSAWATQTGVFWGFSGAAAHLVGGWFLFFIFWLGTTLAIVVPMAKFRVRSDTLGMIELGATFFILLGMVAITWLDIWVLIIILLLGAVGGAWLVANPISRRGGGGG